MCFRKPTNPNSLTTKEITILWKNLKPSPLGKINNDTNKCIQQVQRTEGSGRLQTVIKYNQPSGKRKPGHPLKRQMSVMKLRVEQATMPNALKS
jgi:hypothetical protein